MQQINEASAKTAAGSGFRRAMFAGIDGMRPGYMSQTPHTQAVRHVLPPPSLEIKRHSRHNTALASHSRLKC